MESARVMLATCLACVRGGAAGVCTSHMRNAVVVNVLRCGSGLGDGAGSGRPGRRPRAGHGSNAREALRYYCLEEHTGPSNSASTRAGAATWVQFVNVCFTLEVSR